jgi:hypothetical protein
VCVNLWQATAFPLQRCSIAKSGGVDLAGRKDRLARRLIAETKRRAADAEDERRTTAAECVPIGARCERGRRGASLARPDFGDGAT